MSFPRSGDDCGLFAFRSLLKCDPDCAVKDAVRDRKLEHDDSRKMVARFEGRWKRREAAHSANITS